MESWRETCQKICKKRAAAAKEKEKQRKEENQGRIGEKQRKEENPKEKEEKERKVLNLGKSLPEPPLGEILIGDSGGVALIGGSGAQPLINKIVFKLYVLNIIMK